LRVECFIFARELCAKADEMNILVVRYILYTYQYIHTYTNITFSEHLRNGTNQTRPPKPVPRTCIHIHTYAYKIYAGGFYILAYTFIHTDIEYVRLSVQSLAIDSCLAVSFSSRAKLNSRRAKLTSRRARLDSTYVTLLYANLSLWFHSCLAVLFSSMCEWTRNVDQNLHHALPYQSSSLFSV
jgi:hypothetical protein